MSLFDKAVIDVEIKIVGANRNTLLSVVHDAELMVIFLEVWRYTVSLKAASATVKPLAGLSVLLSAL